MASEASRIVDELTRAIESDPWHGASVSGILGDIDARTAAARPHAAVHSIWELVLHMTGWTREVARRLDGHPPAEPEEGDWPAQPEAPTSEQWQETVAALVAAHRQVLNKVAALSDDRVHAPPAEHRNAPSGSGVSHYVLLHGLAQHHAYHSGQIAVLKKMAAGR